MILEGRDYQARDELVAKINAISEENNLVNGGIVISVGLAFYEAGKGFRFASVFRTADQNMYLRKQQLKAVNNKNNG